MAGAGFQGAGLCVTGHDCPCPPSSFTSIRMRAWVSSPSQCLLRRKTKFCTAAPWRGFMLINFRAQCVFCFNSITARHFHIFQSFYPAFWLFQAWGPKLSKGEKFLQVLVWTFQDENGLFSRILHFFFF